MHFYHIIKVTITLRLLLQKIYIYYALNERWDKRTNNKEALIVFLKKKKALIECLKIKIFEIMLTARSTLLGVLKKKKKIVNHYMQR